MRDSETTKAKIINASSTLFNTKGYKATSISDITKATALTKGAIYRHYQDKSALEQESLKFMCNKLIRDLQSIIKGKKTTQSKLLGITMYFSEYLHKPPFVGGCPLMNAAIESDDTDPRLKSVTMEILMVLHSSIVKIIENGKKHQEVDISIDSYSFASVMISVLEGGVMLLKITNDPQHFKSVIRFLEREIKNLN